VHYNVYTNIEGKVFEQLLKTESYPLETVAFHITPVCSHKCPWCYNRNPLNRATEHPKLETLTAIFDKLKDGGLKKIMYVGGDPASYPFIVPLLNRARDNGIENVVLSNTHNYRDSTVVNFVDSFETTIHGPTAEMHDKITGEKGSYDSVTKKLRQFSEAGKNVGMTYNITPQTLQSFYKSVKNLKDLGVNISYIGVQRIFPQIHIMNQNALKDVLIPASVNYLFRVIDSIETKLGVPVEIWDTFPMKIVPEFGRHRLVKNDWGINIGAADHHGNIFRDGCQVSSMPGTVEKYALGNVFNRPVKEIWNNNPRLNAFRNNKFLPENCQSCKLLSECGGGCIADNGTMEIDYLSRYCR